VFPAEGFKLREKMESFQDLALPAFLHEALKKMNFEKPTPVQAQAIPPALEGKDLIASAETGSGKTAAFGIPLLTFLTNNSSKTALVLTPTRELAEQVSEVIQQLSGGRHDLRFALLIGGVGMDKQVDAIRRGARLFIGTPGRINDHIGQQTLNLSRTGFLVLDEADRMLDMGFAPQLDKMRKWLTGSRQTMLFSATIPPDIEKMAALYLTDPIRVTVGNNSRPVERIKQKILKTSTHRKYDNLVAELRQREGIILVFARTQHGVDQLAQKLSGQSFEVTQIHGGMGQEQRRAALDAFKTGTVRVLVATDVAARGLDVQNIAHVINYDLPYEPEDYIHRIGRTGRAGAEGDSLTFLTPEDDELWNAILKKLGPTQSVIETLPGHFEGPGHAASVSSSHGSPDRHHRSGDSGHHAKHSSGNPEPHRRYSGEKKEHHASYPATAPEQTPRSHATTSSEHRRRSGASSPSGDSRSRRPASNGSERHDHHGRDDRPGKQDRHDRHDAKGHHDRHERYSPKRDSGMSAFVKRWMRNLFG
jgi:superfamily II DNA/RNA helicase